MDKERLDYIDCTRALCMLWIIGVWHLSGYLNANIEISNPFSVACTNGALATFTFISAYFLGQKSVKSYADIVSFWKKRLLRIYPLFFLSCTTFLLINILFHINYISGAKQYFLTLLGVAVFVGESPQTIWFISMIIMFYAFTPFVLRAKFKNRIVSLTLLCLLFYFLNYTIAGFDTRIALLFPFYAVGLILPKWKKLESKISTSYLFVGLVLFIVFALLDSQHSRLLYRTLSAVGVLFVVIEIGKLCQRNKYIDKVLCKISYASMVAYLFHRQFLGVVQILFGRYSLSFAYIIVLPILIIGSYFVQYYYDKVVAKLIIAR